MKNLLVTGATGFLGRAILNRLINDSQYSLVAAVRRETHELLPCIRPVLVGNLDKATNWSQALSAIDVVIHTAARVHIMDDSASDPLAEFHKVNFEGTMKLAEQAVQAGVKRFVFISSIKVNGEKTEPGCPFTADDTAAPVDPYGISKAETEKALLELASSTELEVVIIRPVLVYGPGVKANFQNMMRWTYRGIPLPLGNITNKRSLVAIDNLVDFIIHCADYQKTPLAANEIFLISDDDDVSTTELLQKTAKALGEKSRLISIPVSLLKIIGFILGKNKIINRLVDSLQVDISKAQRLLEWKTVVTMDEQLKKTADAYLKNHE